MAWVGSSVKGCSFGSSLPEQVPVLGLCPVLRSLDLLFKERENPVRHPVFHLSFPYLKFEHDSAVDIFHALDIRYFERL